MSKSKGLSKQLFDAAVFKKADRLDKLYMALIDDTNKFVDKLTDTELNHFEKIKQAYILTCEDINEGTAISKIQKTINGCERWETAKKIYNDMAYVYGNLPKRSKNLARRLYLAKQHSLIEQAEHLAVNTEDLDRVSKMIERAAKLEQLDKDDKFEDIDMSLPNIIISNNPDYARKSPDEIEFEEIEMEALPEAPTEWEEDD